MRSSKPFPIRNLLDNSEASRLFARARALGQLDALVHELLPPPLNEHCRVLSTRDDVLVVAADSAAWATRLRYQSPELVKRLASLASVQLRSVDVRVRAAAVPPVRRARPARQAVSRKNSLALKQAAKNITDAGLKAALLRLAGQRTSTTG